MLIRPATATSDFSSFIVDSRTLLKPGTDLSVFSMGKCLFKKDHGLSERKHEKSNHVTQGNKGSLGSKAYMQSTWKEK